MSDDVNELRGSASAAGYHYLNLYQCCMWKFHLRYNRNLEPRLLSRFLIFGQVFHLIKESFYRAGGVPGIDALIVSMRYELSRRRELYEKQADFDDDLDRGPIMLRKWYDDFGSTDFDRYEILAIEEEMLFPLPGGYEMSVRPDLVVRDRETSNIYAFETKTTSRSASEMAKRVNCEKQVDAQILGINAWLSLQGIVGECSGVIPDIIYKRQSVCTATRDTIVTRTKKELADSKLAFAGLFREIAAKREALDNGVVPESLYSRNGAWCGNFGCEFAAICTARFEGAPPGFQLTTSDVVKVDADA